MWRSVIVLLIFTLSSNSYAAETCSRIAIINYQEVLVDTTSTQKGEGLRFHLEKDSSAKEYLELYQEGSKTSWANAILGTLGSILILSGVFSNGETRNKNSLYIGGISVITINFLVAKTNEYKNEQNLQRAIEEYNKRNLPRILFDPLSENSNSKQSPALAINIVRSF